MLTANGLGRGTRYLALRRAHAVEQRAVQDGDGDETVRTDQTSELLRPGGVRPFTEVREDAERQDAVEDVLSQHRGREGRDGDRVDPGQRGVDQCGHLGVDIQGVQGRRRHVVQEHSRDRPHPDPKSRIRADASIGSNPVLGDLLADDRHEGVRLQVCRVERHSDELLLQTLRRIAGERAPHVDWQRHRGDHGGVGMLRANASNEGSLILVHGSTLQRRQPRSRRIIGSALLGSMREWCGSRTSDCPWPVHSGTARPSLTIPARVRAANASGDGHSPASQRTVVAAALVDGGDADRVARPARTGLRPGSRVRSRSSGTRRPRRCG